MFKKADFSSLYAKGTISLFKGTFLAQVFGFLGTLLIARLYGAESLGIFSKFISLSSVLAIFYTIRLESAFVLSSKESEMKSIFASIIYSILSGFIITILIISVLPNSFYDQVNFLKIYVIFCVLGAVLKSLETTYLSYLLKKKEFKHIALSKVLFTITRYSFQIGLFFIIPKFGLLLGFFVALLSILVFFYNTSSLRLTFISLKTYKQVLKKNLNLVSFGVISDNLNAINLNLIPIFAGIYFSDSEIGWYFLAVVLLSVIVNFINSSYSKVFFLKASEIYNKDTSLLYAFIKKHTLRLCVGLSIPFIVIFFLSTKVILFLFDTQWIQVGYYIQWLCVLFFFRAIYNPLSNLEEVLKKNHIGLVFNIYLLLCNIIAVYFGIETQSFLSVVKIISFTLPFGYLAMIFYFLITTNKLRLH